MSTGHTVFGQDSLFPKVPGHSGYLPPEAVRFFFFGLFSAPFEVFAAFDAFAVFDAFAGFDAFAVFDAFAGALLLCFFLTEKPNFPSDSPSLKYSP